jgi:hypothetical protein
MVVQCLIKVAAVVGIQDISPEWMARLAAMETPALTLQIAPVAGNA